jgi:hypothetical protein
VKARQHKIGPHKAAKDRRTHGAQLLQIIPYHFSRQLRKLRDKCEARGVISEENTYSRPRSMTKLLKFRLRWGIQELDYFADHPASALWDRL